jgi:tetratricopeptide (TPR) repeat protein
MSEEEAVTADEVCASCGTAAVDDVTLKKCACDLVKYCSVACQKNHRPQHKKLCKKRLAELRDDKLFIQPDEGFMGECPICCLPLPIDPSKSTFMNCCSKSICNGCCYANTEREYEMGLHPRCSYCREPAPKSHEEANKRVMKRIMENNDPVAMRTMGKNYYHDEGDYETALKYFTKAAKLGDIEAHYTLSCMYREGKGVDKDEKKRVYHLEEAAIGGHASARYNLGNYEWNNGAIERAKKHWIIAANLGLYESLQPLKDLYAEGHASKEDYADALRAYHAAASETKSAEREKAEEAIKNGDW